MCVTSRVWHNALALVEIKRELKWQFLSCCKTLMDFIQAIFLDLKKNPIFLTDKYVLVKWPADFDSLKSSASRMIGRELIISTRLHLISKQSRKYSDVKYFYLLLLIFLRNFFKLLSCFKVRKMFRATQLVLRNARNCKNLETKRYESWRNFESRIFSFYFWRFLMRMCVSVVYT